MPAPADDLALLLAFVNTLDVEAQTDDIAQARGLRAWFRAHGLGGAAMDVSDADVRDAKALREGLRALLLANNGVHPADEALARLEELLPRLPLHLGLRGQRLKSLPFGAGPRAALAEIAARAAEAMAGPRWPRLKACRNPDCLWAFYDRSRNLSHRWCSMNVCGNRLKARRYRQRSRKTGE